MIERGEEGRFPLKGHEVSVIFEGKIEDGKHMYTPMDSKEEPKKVKIGHGVLLPGLDKGIMAMEQGELADLVVKP